MNILWINDSKYFQSEETDLKSMLKINMHIAISYFQLKLLSFKIIVFISTIKCLIPIDIEYMKDLRYNYVFGYPLLKNVSSYTKSIAGVLSEFYVWVRYAAIIIKYFHIELLQNIFFVQNYSNRKTIFSLYVCNFQESSKKEIVPWLVININK